MHKEKKIVVFGPDNSGKTTLVNGLCETLKTVYGVDMYKVPPLGPALKETQMNYMEENLSREGYVIFDRFPVIEEKTCGTVLRGVDNFDLSNDENVQLFSEYISKVDLFIFCNPGLESILSWGTREQMNGIKENILELLYQYTKQYVLLKKFPNSRVFEYNFNVHGEFDRIIKEVVRE